MSTISLEPIKPHLQPLLAQLSALRARVRTAISKHRLVSALVSSSVLLAILAPYLRRDYVTYLSLGPGGLPHNARGWLLTNILRLFGRETKSVKEYDRSPDHRTFLSGPLPERSGPRAKTAPHPIPHRQLDQHPSAAAKAELVGQFDVLAKEQTALGKVRVSVSMLELHTDALFVAEDVKKNDAATQTNGEIAHVHGTGEGSLHLVLSPQDAKEVIEKGWGERHPLSGVHWVTKAGLRGRRVPGTYLFLYAPRDSEEVNRVLEIVRAAVGYMTSGEDA